MELPDEPASLTSTPPPALPSSPDTAFERLTHYPADERIIERIRAERLEPARRTAPVAWDAAVREGRELDDGAAISLALRIPQD